MSSPRRGGMRRADRVGLALIAVLVAVSLLFGRGGIDMLRDLRGAALDPPRIDAPASTVGAPTAEAPASPAEPPLSAGGYLGEPPKPRRVYPYVNARRAGEVIAATHEFEFEGHSYRVSVPIDSELYRAAKNAEHRISEDPRETAEERERAAFRYMVQDAKQAPIIAETAEQLRAIARRQKLGPARYAELIAKYVQTMPYDFSKLESGNLQSEFPLVTLVDGTGVCGDKSLLLGALLAYEGYDTALLLFDAENHMAVGIKGPGDSYGDSGYLFVESTNPTYISEIPGTFVSGVKLTSDPEVIPIGEGTVQYSEAAGVAQILRVRSATQGARDKLFRKASRERLTAAQAKDVNGRLETAYESQFKLGVITGHEDEYLDRRLALRWIAKNCWWD